MGLVIELRLEPTSDRFDAADDRWLDQIATLVTDLKQNAGPVDRRGEPVPGTKGMLETIVMPIASAGVLTATVEMLKAWVGRDRSRSVKVTWAADGAMNAMELAGSGADDDAFDDIVSAITRQLQARP